MSAAVVTIERNLVYNVTVSASPLSIDVSDRAALDDRLTVWRRYNTQLGLTGALLVSGDGIALVLEGTAPSIKKLRRHIDANPLNGNVQLLAEAVCLRRRFGAWPLAYVGPSRWVERALANHALADMAAESPSDADFLIDLMLSFVGEGA